jgi:hypothetical protein
MTGHQGTGGSMIKPGELAAAAGVGLAAGVAGTAAMSLSSTIEARVRHREPSTAPAGAASKLLGVKPEGEEQAKRFNVIVHWAYGTGWGAVRGLLGCTGLPAPAASAVHLAALWGSEQVMLPALGVSPPLTRQRPAEIAIAAWHELVYVAAAGAAYEALNRTR